MKIQTKRILDCFKRFENQFGRMVLVLIFLSMFGSSTRAENFFVKPGVGLAFGNENPKDKIPDFSSSLGAGLEYSDGFSFFSSVDLIVSNNINLNTNKISHLTVTLNAEYKLLNLKFIKPYVFVGPGLDILGNLLGFGLQVGLGSEIQLTKGTDFFIEGKYLGAEGGDQHDTYVYQYFPIVDCGLKLLL